MHDGDTTEAGGAAQVTWRKIHRSSSEIWERHAIFFRLYIWFDRFPIWGAQDNEVSISMLSWRCAVWYRPISLSLCHSYVVYCLYLLYYFFRENTNHWKVKRINATEQRAGGFCPLTPKEMGIFLRALGYPSSTQIYIAAGEIYGGDTYLSELKSRFPNIVFKVCQQFCFFIA